MTSLEQYLLSLGYERQSYNGTQWGPARAYLYSTLGDIAYRYNHRTLPEVMFGLNEAGKPPTLVHPRFVIEIRNGDYQWERMCNDDEMNRLLSNWECKRIFEDVICKKYRYRVCGPKHTVENLFETKVS